MCPDDVTVVADAGMVSEANQKQIEAAGLSFILGMKIPHIPYVVKQWRGASFSDGEVDFGNTTFSADDVEFGDSTITDGTVSLGGARFIGGTVSFSRASFSGGTQARPPACYRAPWRLPGQGLTAAGDDELPIRS